MAPPGEAPVTHPTPPPLTPSGRKVVVVRPGPPEGRSKVDDWVAGILGALLLILAGVLVVALPEEDRILPQFQVSVLEPTSQFPTQTYAFTDTEEGNEREFKYDVPVDNVYLVAVRVAFVDDRPASLPDRFTVELFDPQGDIRGTEQTVMNAEPTPPPQGSLAFTPVQLDTTLTFTIGERPQDQIVEGLRPDETADEVLQRIGAPVHLATAGTWTVRVRLAEAGGCPPSPDASNLQRYLACASESRESPDTGNSFDVELFSYSGFALDIIPLE